MYIFIKPPEGDSILLSGIVTSSLSHFIALSTNHLGSLVSVVSDLMVTFFPAGTTGYCQIVLNNLVIHLASK